MPATKKRVAHWRYTVRLTDEASGSTENVTVYGYDTYGSNTQARFNASVQRQHTLSLPTHLFRQFGPLKTIVMEQVSMTHNVTLHTTDSAGAEVSRVHDTNARVHRRPSNPIWAGRRAGKRRALRSERWTCWRRERGQQVMLEGLPARTRLTNRSARRRAKTNLEDAHTVGSLGTGTRTIKAI